MRCQPKIKEDDLFLKTDKSYRVDIPQPRYQALVGGSEPLQSFLHKRLAENLNSEAALGTIGDVAQCVQWLTSTFLCVRAAKDPKRYLGLLPSAPQQLITKKIEELCVRAMNGLATAGLITMDEACCIESTEAGRLMSIYYLDLETMKLIMKINGTETLEQLLKVICDCHELADMHLRVDERRCLNALNRNNAAATIRYPMKGKITTRQMKLNCIIQAILGCLPIPDPSLNQEAMKIMRIADRICKCLVAYVTRPDLISRKPQYLSAVLNSLLLAKCVAAHLWENSPYVSKQLKGIGPAFSNSLATAGKVNFLLLEESHPRDLERIMNKGPPAGNVIRKQISLLPKYHLTMTPVDERIVSVQLVLLNQSHLADNLDHLTAGDTHKSYIVVGDSENYLLQLTSFKDKDLISVYDGTITYEITRKNCSEHKIFAHCISSNFVGIDAQCEYTFKDLEPLYPRPSAMHDDMHSKKITISQTKITDSFKERKRRNTSENDITQSKEKKKRDTAVIEKLKNLKESFSITPKQFKKDLNASAEMSNKKNHGLTDHERSDNVDNVIKTYPGARNDNDNCLPKNNCTDFPILEHNDSNDSMNDENINNILKEIETEITKLEEMPRTGYLNEDPVTSHSLVNSKEQNTKYVANTFSTKYITPNINPDFNHKQRHFTQPNIKKRKCQNTKSNYRFMDILEKNMEFSEDEENNVLSKDSGFTDTIKLEINKYLEKTKNASKIPDKIIEDVLEISDTELPDVNIEENCNDAKEMPTNLTSNALMAKERPELETQHEFFYGDSKPQGNIKTQNNKENNRAEVEMHNLTNGNESEGSKTIINERSQSKKNENQLVPFQNNTPNITPTHAIDSKCFMNKLSHFAKDNSAIKHNIAVDALIPRVKTDVAGRADNTKVEKALLNEIYTQTALRNCLVSKNSSAISKNATVTENNCSTLLPINPAILPVATDHANHNTPSTEDNQQKYTNRYSFTTTKIDVCTKNTPEHVIHIIRKLKVDLDVTEMVSKNGATNRTENKNKENNKHKFIDKPNEAKHENEAIEKFHNGETQLNMSDIIDTKYISNDKPLIEFNSENKTQSRTLANNTIFKEIDHSSNMTKYIETENNFEVNDTTKESNNTKANNGIGDCITQSNKEKSHQEKPHEDSSENTINNKITSILQKYNKIQERRNTLEDINQNTGLKIRDNNRPTEKPKRPFKISEIDYQNFKLPTTIIKEPHCSYKDSFIPIKTNMEPSTNEQFKQCDDMHINTHTNKVSTDEEVIIKQNTKDKFSENAIPNMDINDSTNIGFDIDESMFDPKTLLQCLGKDDSDEIIPPPPQFSDYAYNYSPQYNSQIDDGLNSSLWTDDIEMDEYHNSIVLDTTEITLAFSQEVETWALSREDSWEGRQPQDNSLVDYTVMQKNPPHRNPLFQSVAASRNKKLGQFKYSKKDKLKLKM